MSTFDGRVSEFPDIRIDFFRRQTDAQPPLVCFLSHVHSDHLAGLESLRSPLCVYCSAATREILLRLERYPCRINYAKGILEARQQTYKHLNKVLKPLPLDTPTCLEIRPGHQIQVTLFDANHCPGAVMFLIEGSGKAVLYTGDIRSEPWFVNSLTRSPNLIEYSSGIKRIDKIYLDTSFTRDIPFQTKAEGIAELIKKVVQYPSDTVFHLQAWTYGYEEVWVALSRALKSPIHVDDYKMGIYNSLKMRQPGGRFSADVHLSPEAPALVGYMSGNTPQPGCLTSDTNVRLHSCEKGSMCSTAKGGSVVRIQPVIAHLSDGGDLAEMGVGGGGDDLERDAELDLSLNGDLETLLQMLDSLDNSDNEGAAEAKKSVLLSQIASGGRKISLDLDLASFDDHQSATLERALRALAHREVDWKQKSEVDAVQTGGPLAKVIRFPYSRHSSYPELCHLVEAFRPSDVWPCTVNPEQWLRDGISISSLFGRFCDGQEFAHDQVQATWPRPDSQGLGLAGIAQHVDTQTTTNSQDFVSPQNADQVYGTTAHPAENVSLGTGSSIVNDSMDVDISDAYRTGLNTVPPKALDPLLSPSSKRGYDDYVDDDVMHDEPSGQAESQESERSFTSSLSTRHSIAQREAYYNMLEYMDNDVWTPIGLISTGANHTAPDKEL